MNTLMLSRLLGVTALGILCASALATGSRRQRETARRTHVAAKERASRA